MKTVARRGLAIALASGLVFFHGLPATAMNSVFVESKSVAPGAHGVTLDIKITNDSALAAIVIPLVIQSRDPGSFITALTAQRTPGGRLDGVLTGISFIWYYGIPSDSCGRAPGGFRDPTGLDFVSPDGVMFVLGKFYPSEEPLAPGRDSTTGSLRLTFDVTNGVGEFDIDTTCVTPGNHLLFAIDNVAGDTAQPRFTWGEVVIQDLGWWPECRCPSPPAGCDVITSPFGPRNPNPPAYGYHDGIDIDFAATGEAVGAVSTGWVAKLTPSTLYGWTVRIRCGGPNQSSSPMQFTSVYKHLQADPPIDTGQMAYRGAVIGYCSDYGGSHVHLSAYPGFQEGERAHPVRYLVKPDDGCPMFDAGAQAVGTPGSYDYLLCRSLNAKSERYDLTSMRVFTYTPTGCRDTIIDFENFSQMDTAVAGPAFSFFAGTDYAVTVTLTPEILVTSHPYHKVDIKVDPVRPFPDLGYIGISLSDAGPRGCPQYPPSPETYIGNITRQTPGTLMTLFLGCRIDQGVELRWCGTQEVDARGVRVFRSVGGGPEELVEDGLLPFRGVGRDTVIFVDRDVSKEEGLVYRLSVELGNGMSLFAGSEVRIPGAAHESTLPMAFQLGQNFPNPFNASTQIPFSIDAASSGPVRIRVLDILGRRVATIFASDQLSPGQYLCNWDCRDSYGQGVASGIYFYRLDTRDRHVSRKMVLLK